MDETYIKQQRQIYQLHENGYKALEKAIYGIKMPSMKEDMIEIVSKIPPVIPSVDVNICLDFKINGGDIRDIKITDEE